MLFVACMQEVLKCYENNAQLIGNQQRRQFTLVLTPLSDNKFCLAGDEESSEMFILYYQDSVIKNISAIYTHSSTEPMRILFDLSDDAAMYNFIQKQVKLSYFGKIYMQLESKGSISQISHTQMNNTNCWSDIALTVDFAEESLLITCRPLDCIISDVFSVQMQIAGKKQAVFRLLGKEQDGYYYHGSSFEFQEVRNYYLEADQLDSAAEKQQFSELLEGLLRAAQPRITLVLHSRVSAALTQETKGDVERVLFSEQGCLHALHPRGHLNAGNFIVRLDVAQAEARCGMSGDLHAYFSHGSYVSELLTIEQAVVSKSLGFVFGRLQAGSPQGDFIFYMWGASGDAGGAPVIDSLESRFAVSAVTSLKCQVNEKRICSEVLYEAGTKNPVNSAGADNDLQSDQLKELQFIAKDTVGTVFSEITCKPNYCCSTSAQNGQSGKGSFAAFRSAYRHGQLQVVAQNEQEMVLADQIIILDNRIWQVSATIVFCLAAVVVFTLSAAAIRQVK